MKLLILSLTLLMATVSVNANEKETIAKEITGEALLYGGTIADVASHLEMDLRNNAIIACGSADKVLGLAKYKINVSLNGFNNNRSMHLMTIDMETPDYQGPFVSSLLYPAGSATAEVVCLK